jgi:CBS domain containing-hemolysin-like protein
MFLSAAFSGSETALTSLGRLEAQKLVSRGGSVARLTQEWVRDPGRVLITILVGNNIANIAASSVFALWAAKKFPDQVTLSVVALTLTFIVLSEITPKLMARQVATEVAPLAMRFLNFVYLILFPLIWLLKKLTTGLVLLSGMPGRERRTPMSEEDISHTIELATREGGIDQATGEVLSNLIEFPDRLAMHVMTPRSKVAALSVSWSWEQVLRYVSVDGHSRYPVYRNNMDHIVGILLVKDLFKEIQKPSPGSWTRRIRRPYYVSEMNPLGNILRDMKRWGTHMALVRNESGVITGLVTLEDLIEEIVGDIRDEHDDPSEAGHEQALGGPRMVSGEIPIVDFNDHYDLSLPVDSAYSTLNGYLLMRTGGQIPAPGTLIIDDEVTFRIQSISDQGIATVELIEPFTSDSSDDD